MPGDELVRFRLECSTNMYEQSTDILGQARFVTVGTRFAKRLLYGSKYGMVRSVTA